MPPRRRRIRDCSANIFDGTFLRQASHRASRLHRPDHRIFGAEG